MAFLNIPIKDNSTPLTVTEWNYLIDKLNNRRLNNLIDVQSSDPIDKNIIRHNGSGWVYYDIETDFYTKAQVNSMFGTVNAMPTNTSDLINDGNNGVDPFITIRDISGNPVILDTINNKIIINVQDIDNEFNVKQTFNHSILLKEILEPNHEEGLIFYDNVKHCLTVYDDISNTSLQVGQELRVRVYNSNSQTIPNGSAVTVTGTTAEGILEVHLAIANDEISALNTIGIATHDIPVGTYGWATIAGSVNGLDTSMFDSGIALFLSDTEAGKFTTIKPNSPNYEVRMGGVIRSGATDGIIYAEVRIINNTQGNFKFFNGSILGGHSGKVETNGATVIYKLYNTENVGGVISLIFDNDYKYLPDQSSIALTLGTDSVPVNNFIYVPKGTGVMTISTTGFPNNEQYVPLGQVLCPSASRAHAIGVYKSHAWTDHLSNSIGQGHLSHINAWIRSRPAQWSSGVSLITTPAIGTPSSNIEIALTSGVINQLHSHIFPSFDTATTDFILIPNSPITPYKAIGSINTVDLTNTSDGAVIGNNKYFNVVLWAVISEENKDCQVFINIPSSSYTNISDALIDINRTANYTIPSQFTGSGFLLYSFTIFKAVSTVTIVSDSLKDLRGLFPSVSGGGTIGGASITKFDELLDTPATKIGNSLNGLRVNLAENAIEYYKTTFFHNQGIPSVLWNVNHNLGKYPSVTVLSNDGSEYEGDVKHIDNNNLTIEFSVPVSGNATIN